MKESISESSILPNLNRSESINCKYGSNVASLKIGSDNSSARSDHHITPHGYLAVNNQDFYRPHEFCVDSVYVCPNKTNLIIKTVILVLYYNHSQLKFI